MVVLLIVAVIGSLWSHLSFWRLDVNCETCVALKVLHCEKLNEIAEQSQSLLDGLLQFQNIG